MMTEGKRKDNCDTKDVKMRKSAEEAEVEPNENRVYAKVEQPKFRGRKSIMTLTRSKMTSEETQANFKQTLLLLPGPVV